MRIWDTYDYCISEHLLPALINGDMQFLDEADGKVFSDWEKSVRSLAVASGWTVGHWSTDDALPDIWVRCSVSGLYSSCAKVQLCVYKDEVTT